MKILTALALITHELNIFFNFTWRDWSTTIIPGTIFAIGGVRNTNQSLPFIAINYLFLISWLTCFVYFFTLSNQITGVDEDRINKPDRLIPSGRVTLAGAKVRWIIVLSAFLAVAATKPSILPETICWVFTVGMLSLTPVGGHWFGKNIFAISMGARCMLSASWKAVALPTSKSERWTYGVAAWMSILLQIQDLRDVKGDRAIGRKTISIVFGDRGSRWIITFVLMPISVYALYLGGILELAPRMLMVANLFLVYRVMHSQGSRYDHKTYMIFTYIFCLTLAVTAGEGLEIRKYCKGLLRQR